MGKNGPPESDGNAYPIPVVRAFKRWTETLEQGDNGVEKAHMSDVTEFTRAVSQTIKRIPRGRVATYGLIAMLAGNPRAARQVVRILHTRSKIDKLPWHRVINASGKIALKPGQGFEMQRAMLAEEGVETSSTGQIDLDRYLWRPDLDRTC
ncbi:MAG: hypothetical protein Kow0074_23380 [Candidatus Zixiibacteriota bacterium]